MRLAALLLSTLITSNCLGQTAKILPPENPIAGEMVRFNAEFEGDDIDWLVYPPVRYSDAIDRATKKYFIEFVPKPGIDYLIQLDAYKVVEGKFSKVKDQKIFRIGKPIPPGPDPDPDPDPDPEPDNLSDLGKKVRDWAKEVGNKTETKQIADNYAAINAAIAAGAYNNLADWNTQRGKVVSDLYEKNHPISQNNEKWNGFFTRLSGEMRTLEENGKLPNLPSLLGVLQAIQEGLEAAK